MTTSKSLNEQINEIKAANTTLAAKKRAVLNLGITKYEADLLISEISTYGSNCRMKIAESPVNTRALGV